MPSKNGRAGMVAVGSLAAVLAAILGMTGLTLADAPPRPTYQSQAEADRKSVGCISCHTSSDSRSMHTAPDAYVSCVDCHGGHGEVMAAGAAGSREYEQAKIKAHVASRTGAFRTAANPPQSYTALLKESAEFVRFVNPGDLRAAPVACGPCHGKQVKQVSTSLMTTGSMLYAAALYNNGVLPEKNALVGESYDPETGVPRLLKANPAPTPEETKDYGALPFLVPFPRWEVGQTGNPFRVFERGGRRKLEIGLPEI